MKEEKWRYIPGFPKYLVSSEGRVKSFKRGIGKILRAGINSSGYVTVSLFQNGKGNSKGVHQLVAMAFLSHIPNGVKMVVNHIDRNQLNNRLENLEIITQRENTDFKHQKKKATSKFKGVSLVKSTNKWRAEIYIDGKTKYLGCFKTEEEAYVKYKSSIV